MYSHKITLHAQSYDFYKLNINILYILLYQEIIYIKFILIIDSYNNNNNNNNIKNIFLCIWYDFSCFIQLGNAIKFVNVACTYTHFIIMIDKYNDCYKRHSSSLLFMGIAI